MSVTINAKGTSTTSFKVGKAGTTITQGGVISPPAATNLKIDLDIGQYLDIDAGISGPSVITTSDNQDLHINPAVGGGQYLVLVANRWPGTDGTAGQTLITDGLGTLSFGSPAPRYQEFVATASQTVFNTTIKTTAKSAGRVYLQVFVNGVFQQEGASKQFTVTGANQITFTAGLALNSDVVVFGYA